jgi:hypothetical protein
MLRQGSEHDGARVRVEALAVCPARLTTRRSVVAPGKSWSNFVVVTTLLVDSKVGIVNYWSAKEWREFCHPSRANEAPPASQPAQHLSGSFQLNEARVRRILRFGYLAPDIIEAIAEGRQPRCMTVKRLLQGVPCVWAEQRIAFGFAH